MKNERVGEDYRHDDADDEYNQGIRDYFPVFPDSP
jgi:hypothetical protein